MKISGSALITALFIMSIVAIAATSMSVNLQSDIYRTHLKNNADESYLATQGVSFWAMAELSTHPKDKKKLAQDSKIWRFPVIFPQQKLAYPGWQVSGEINDLQGYYNLNNLQDTQAIPGFLNFLKHLLPNSSSNQRRKITLAIVNWLSKPKPGRNLHDNFYQSQSPPYLTAHLPFVSISELKLVKGISPEIYNKLFPYITVLPEQTKININSASKAVLYALGYQITESQVMQIMQARGSEGFNDIKELQQKLKSIELPLKSIVINSDYFLVTATATNTKQHLIVYTNLHRQVTKKSKINVSIISQRLMLR